MKKATQVVVKQANQYVSDPRKAYFLAYYLDPESPTFSNAKASALQAGYEETYASNITDLMPAWFEEALTNSKAQKMLEKAERNLDKFLDLQTRVQAMGAFGPIFEKVITKKKVKLKNGKTKMKNVVEKIPVMVEHSKLLEIQQKSSHFVTERIGRKIYGKDAVEPNAPLRPSVVNIASIIINPPKQSTPV